MQEQIAVCVSDFPCFTANGENFAKIGERSAVIAALRAKNNEKNCTYFNTHYFRSGRIQVCKMHAFYFN